MIRAQVELLPYRAGLLLKPHRLRELVCRKLIARASRAAVDCVQVQDGRAFGGYPCVREDARHVARLMCSRLLCAKSTIPEKRWPESIVATGDPIHQKSMERSRVLQ
jgi:hypothetical protein